LQPTYRKLGPSAVTFTLGATTTICVVSSRAQVARGRGVNLDRWRTTRDRDQGQTHQARFARIERSNLNRQPFAVRMLKPLG